MFLATASCQAELDDVKQAKKDRCIVTFLAHMHLETCIEVKKTLFGCNIYILECLREDSLKQAKKEVSDLTNELTKTSKYVVHKIQIVFIFVPRNFPLKIAFDSLYGPFS